VNKYTRICKTFGYVWQKVKNHPGFPGATEVKQHHLVWWRYRKERVPRGYVLHHIDEDRTNNKLKNLKLMTNAEHVRLHSTGRKLNDAQRKNASVKAKRRCTPEWKAAVSERVKLQHAQGKFGQATWINERKLTEAERLRLSDHAKRRHAEGTFGGPWSEESKARMSARMRGNKNSVGRKWTVEQKANLSKKAKARFAAHPEIFARPDMKGNKRAAGYKNSLGYKFTEEQKANLKKAKERRRTT
jgi:hypothetical protein